MLLDIHITAGIFLSIKCYSYADGTLFKPFATTNCVRILAEWFICATSLDPVPTYHLVKDIATQNYV